MRCIAAETGGRYVRSCKLKVTRRSGSTYLPVRIKNPVKGTLKCRLRASSLGFGTGANETITQVTKAK